MCQGRSTPYNWGMVIPPLMTEIRILGVHKTVLYVYVCIVGLMTIPYYTEIMAVYRPSSTYIGDEKPPGSHPQR